MQVLLPFPGEEELFAPSEMLQPPWTDAESESVHDVLGRSVLAPPDRCDRAGGGSLADAAVASWSVGISTAGITGWVVEQCQPPPAALGGL